MYAVIESGGKQYRVEPEKLVKVEKLEGQAGEKVIFDRILLMHDGVQLLIGTPTVKGALVESTVVGQVKSDKIIIYKYKKRKGYHKKQGHRQVLTSVRITDIHPPVADAR